MVKIRLRRIGAKKQPSYRVVVADSRAPRDGRFIETIGHYDPRTDPPRVVIFEDRALHWLSVGAQPSEPVAHFFEKLGLPGKLAQVHGGAKIAEVAAPRPTGPARPATADTTEGKPVRGRARKAAAPVEAPVAPAIEAPVVEATAAEAAVVEAPTVEAPAAEAAVVEAPTVEAPTVEAPVVEAPAVEAPVEPETAKPDAAAKKAARPPKAAPKPPAPPLADLGLGARVQKALEADGITDTEALVARFAEGPDALLAISGIGEKAVDEIAERLREHGLIPRA